MVEVFHRAHEHNGAAFIEIYQNCNVFNNGTFEGLVGKENRADMLIELKQGEPVLLMGKIHFLEIVSSNKSGISADGNKILIDEKFSSNLKAALTIFFKIYAKNIIPLRFGFIKQRLKIHINGIKISNAERRWGSCSLKKNLNFNWRLAMVPPEVIDYVIIHEIAHLREMNHSDRFWSIVSSMMPDYKIRKKWLKDNDHLMKW